MNRRKCQCLIGVCHGQSHFPPCIGFAVMVRVRGCRHGNHSRSGCLNVRFLWTDTIYKILRSWLEYTHLPKYHQHRKLAVDTATTVMVLPRIYKTSIVFWVDVGPDNYHYLDREERSVQGRESLSLEVSFMSSCLNEKKNEKMMGGISTTWVRQGRRW